MLKKYFSLLVISSILISFSYLSWIQYSQHDYDFDKNWWVLYFENPKNSSLDYLIENHSDMTDFHSEIFLEKQKVSESDFTLQKNERKRFPVDTTDLQDKKVTIVITTGEQKKEVYKIIN